MLQQWLKVKYGLQCKDIQVCAPEVCACVLRIEKQLERYGVGGWGGSEVWWLALSLHMKVPGSNPAWGKGLLYGDFACCTLVCMGLLLFQHFTKPKINVLCCFDMQKSLITHYIVFPLTLNLDGVLNSQTTQW